MLIGKITMVMQKAWHELNILTIGTIHIILYMYTKLKIHYQILPNIVSEKTIYTFIFIYSNFKTNNIPQSRGYT